MKALFMSKQSCVVVRSVTAVDAQLVYGARRAPESTDQNAFKVGKFCFGHLQH